MKTIQWAILIILSINLCVACYRGGRLAAEKECKINAANVKVSIQRVFGEYRKALSGCKQLVEILQNNIDQ